MPLSTHHVLPRKRAQLVAEEQQARPGGGQQQQSRNQGAGLAAQRVPTRAAARGAAVQDGPAANHASHVVNNSVRQCS